MSGKSVSLFRRLLARRGRLVGGGQSGDPAAARRLADGDAARADALADLVIEIESAGNPDLYTPSTGALGPGQFLAATWLKLIGQCRPDLASLPRDRVLAMRTDPVLAREMVVHLLVQHSRQLRAAGLVPTHGTLYLAHFLGLPAAVRTMKAPPRTPILDVVGPAPVAHNPLVLEGKTAGEVREWAARSMRIAALRSSRAAEPAPAADPPDS
jgi:hypothetical protein